MEYSHTQVSRVFPKLKSRSLISWVELGLITPLKDAYGRGSSRRYSYRNLIEISVINELRAYEIPVQTIKSLMLRSEFKLAISSNEPIDIIRVASKLSIDVQTLARLVDRALEKI